MNMMYGQKLEGLGERLGKWAAHVVNPLAPALLSHHYPRRPVLLASPSSPSVRIHALWYMIDAYGKSFPV